jgi:6-phosphogluconate dehydrogenase (decarboxylating)
MRFGIIGLGRMGGNLARAAMDRGHRVVGYNRDGRLTAELAREGRIVLLYVPHGAPTEQVCDELGGRLARGDVIVDGGNVEDTGEVKWVLEWAQSQDIPSPVIAGSQQALMSYRDLDWPAAKAVALLRHGYGGHPVHTRDEQPVGQR